MKKILFTIALLLTGSLANASIYQGKLDLGSTNPSALALRELHDGMWLVGGQTQIWHLQDNESGNEVFHISGFYATRLEGQDTAYGPSIGLNLGESSEVVINKIEDILPELEPLINFTFPPFVKKLSSFTSVEIYTGYRPVVSSDDHRWIYGVGGKVTIPVNQLYSWAIGTKNANGTSLQKGL